MRVVIAGRPGRGRALRAHPSRRRPRGAACGDPEAPRPARGARDAARRAAARAHGRHRGLPGGAGELRARSCVTVFDPDRTPRACTTCTTRRWRSSCGARSRSRPIVRPSRSSARAGRVTPAFGSHGAWAASRRGGRGGRERHGARDRRRRPRRRAGRRRRHGRGARLRHRHRLSPQPPRPVRTHPRARAGGVRVPARDGAGAVALPGPQPADRRAGPDGRDRRGARAQRRADHRRPRPRPGSRRGRGARAAAVVGLGGHQRPDQVGRRAGGGRGRPGRLARHRRTGGAGAARRSGRPPGARGAERPAGIRRRHRRRGRPRPGQRGGPALAARNRRLAGTRRSGRYTLARSWTPSAGPPSTATAR